LTEADGRFSLDRVDQDPLPVWLPFVAIAWTVFVVGISIVFRRSKGKPVFPVVPSGALYVDKWASGRWASNCLLVAVTDNAVTVVPRFPFNLMFLPEVYGLERTIPMTTVREVRRLQSFGLFNNVAVVYDDGVQRELRLRVRKPQAFVDAVGRSPLVRISD
jgi:hypothetical protein